MSSASLSSLAKVNLDPLLAFVMIPTSRRQYMREREGKVDERVLSTSPFIWSSDPLNLMNKLGFSSQTYLPPFLLIAFIIVSSSNSTQATPTPCCTISRTASAARRMVGKEVTATVVGRRGTSLRVASTTIPRVPSLPMKSFERSGPAEHFFARCRVCSQDRQ